MNGRSIGGGGEWRASIDDEQLERLAHEKGVGSLVEPTANKNRAGEGAPVAPGITGSQIDAGGMPSASTPRSRMKTVNLELPDYVWTDLKIRLKLLKIGAVVTVSVGRIKLAFATACPVKDVFTRALERLRSLPTATGAAIAA